MSESTQGTSRTGTQAQPKKLQIPMLAVIIASAVLLTMIIRQPIDELAASVAKVAVVDMDRILKAKALSVGANVKAPDAVAGEADSFARSIKEQMDHLTDSGFIVINTAHLVAWPHATDRTQEIATQLGLDLKLVDADEATRGARVQDLLSQSAKPRP